MPAKLFTWDLDSILSNKRMRLLSHFTDEQAKAWRISGVFPGPPSWLPHPGCPIGESYPPHHGLVVPNHPLGHTADLQGSGLAAQTATLGTGPRPCHPASSGQSQGQMMPLFASPLTPCCLHTQRGFLTAELLSGACQTPRHARKAPTPPAPTPEAAVGSEDGSPWYEGTNPVPQGLSWDCFTAPRISSQTSLPAATLLRAASHPPLFLCVFSLS